MKKNNTWAHALTAALVASAPFAVADIVSGTLTGGSSFDEGGIFLEIPAPAILGNNAFNDDNVRAFNEAQAVTVTENLIMDLAAPDLDSNVLAPDSVISSHYVIYDPLITRSAIGSVTFDEPVVGVIISTPRFDETDDLLGNPGTDYAIGNQSLESSDAVSISGNTINFDIQSVQPGDAIRVLTGTDTISAINACPGATQTITGSITGGSVFTRGGQFRQICDPIGPVGSDNFDSFDLFAFEEQQAVELTAPLALDDTTVIATGEVVSSFYVVFDPGPSNSVVATLTFPDEIIGVITTRNELQDSEFLGNASAVYLNPGLLGLEGGDTVSINGASLTLNFSANSPGDSIRVILGSASPSLNVNFCSPEDTTLSGQVTGGTAASEGGTFAQICDPIGPVGNDNFQVNDLLAFEEAQGVTLSTDVTLDEPVDTILPAGTLVSSYYVSFDPGANRTIVGNVTFPEPILGILSTVDALTDTDAELGNPTGFYLNPGLRGLEAGDAATFNGNSVSVEFSASSPGDYVRVLVGAPDTDGDGVADAQDNCTLDANSDQTDADGDGYGNTCDADFNNDCTVNFVDLGILRTVFFSADAQADLNVDGVVNFVDLGILRQLFFAAPGPSAFSDDCG